MDWERHRIGALEPGDRRAFELRVAGPAGLIVAKVHKIMDRDGYADRSRDKDALDVYRLLRAVHTQVMGMRFRGLLEDPLSRSAAEKARAMIPQLFGRRSSSATQMAVRAAGPLEDPVVLAASLAALAQDLSAALA